MKKPNPLPMNGTPSKGRPMPPTKKSAPASKKSGGKRGC